MSHTSSKVVVFDTTLRDGEQAPGFSMDVPSKLSMARALDALGVDIIENCEVTGMRIDSSGSIEGIETTRGYIRSKKVGVVAAGNTSVVMGYAGIQLPLESYPLQALVSEPVKPIMPCVVMSNTIHAYMSQSDKGELVIGAGTDAYNSYTQRGALHINTHTLEAICELFPIVRRLKMLRNWGGIVDCTPDRSPIISKTPVQGLYVNCGWGTGGFKATPGSGWVMAHTIATGEPQLLSEIPESVYEDYVTDPEQLRPALLQAQALAQQHRVPVVVEVILEKVTNISMGTEINQINEFEAIDCKHPEGLQGLELAGLLD